jgi:hypothetical protein
MHQEQSGADTPTFWVIVLGHYAKVFAVFGPLSEDSEWNARVGIAQRQGKDLTISTVASELDAREITDRLTASGFANNEAAIQELVGANTRQP